MRAIEEAQARCRLIYREPHPSCRPWSFSVALSVYSDANALIANNQLPLSRRTWNVTVSFLDSKGGQMNVTTEYLSNNRYGALPHQLATLVPALPHATLHRTPRSQASM